MDMAAGSAASDAERPTKTWSVTRFVCLCAHFTSITSPL